MANEEHLAILRQGMNVWNKWRRETPEITPDIRGAHIKDIKLEGVNFRGASLSEVNLSGAYLSDASFRGADLSGADLSMAYLVRADFIDANLSDAYLIRANLVEANLNGAYLSRVCLKGAVLKNATLRKADIARSDLRESTLMEADLRWADLRKANLAKADLRDANLRGANLQGANLREATLVKTNLSEADISDCKIYGISAWNLDLEGVIQKNLVITPYRESVITIDNLEVAQFVYLLLHNEKIRDVIDTITTKAVLILGRFSEGRKVVLDAIRDELRQRDYVPILFDFDKPVNRNLTETVITLASLARFVIADLSDPSSIPHEVMAFAEKLRAVPVQPIFCPTPAHPHPYSMFKDLIDLQNMLPIYAYKHEAELLMALPEKIIAPAEVRFREIQNKRKD